ncbi:MAG TPA: bifunctional oligoribonuclease/PAP phosphatase NrnA [Firmicutes bacterium]|jgi:phosphoesterase RecJ-like protein|nr:bifunctional oligoribonuclease/PAP phosphatase NrnA [Bacillota bacterium]
MIDVDLEALLQEYEQIHVFTHVRPDGDAIGSSLAWGKALEQMGKKVRLFCPDDIPIKYSSFIPDINISSVYSPPENTPTLAFALDCSDLERLDYMKEDVLRLDKLFNIDHHGTNVKFGDYNLVDPSAAATGEIIYRLIEDLQIELTTEMSLYLYIALASDTGSFKYENTTPQTMYIAGKLLEKGVSPSFVSLKIFDEISFSSFSLLRDCLQSLKMDKTGRIAWMSADEGMLARYRVASSELEGYINYAKNIIGVEVGVFFYHTLSGETRVGFRSKNVDVSSVAFSLGGGGHLRAAGCSVAGKPEEVEEMVIQKVSQLISG